MKLLQDMIAEALNHQGGHVRYDGNGAVDQFIPVAPASVRNVILGEALPVQAGTRTISATELKQKGVLGRMATLPANDNHAVGQRAAFLPVGTAAGKQTDLSGSILENSLVAAAGARIVIVPEAPEAVSNGVRMVQRPASFVIVEAGSFAATPDGTDLTASALPLKKTDINLEAATSYGVRFTLSRRDLKDLNSDVTTDAAWTAIGLGLANKADELLLAALKAANLPQYTLGDATARGLHWAELSAIAGTNSNLTTTVDGFGSLRVSGVRAELSNKTDTTFVGCFERSGVAIHENLTVTALRTKSGGVEIVCWANMQALVPDTTVFWRV